MTKAEESRHGKRFIQPQVPSTVSTVKRHVISVFQLLLLAAVWRAVRATFVAAPILSPNGQVSQWSAHLEIKLGKKNPIARRNYRLEVVTTFELYKCPSCESVGDPKNLSSADVMRSEETHFESCKTNNWFNCVCPRITYGCWAIRPHNLIMFIPRNYHFVTTTLVGHWWRQLGERLTSVGSFASHCPLHSIVLCEHLIPKKPSHHVGEQKD